LEEGLPDYVVLLSSESGPTVRVHATIRNGMILRLLNEMEGTQKFVLRIKPPCLTLRPSTYTVRALINGKEVWVRTLTVIGHPEYLRQEHLRLPQAGEIVG
jgi:hypothetical protein